MDNRLCFGLTQKYSMLPVEEPSQCTQSLSSILEQTEDYLKPISPLFTFPENRYQHVTSSEDSQEGGRGSRHQLKLVIEAVVRGATSPTVTRVFLEPTGQASWVQRKGSANLTSGHRKVPM